MKAYDDGRTAIMKVETIYASLPLDLLLRKVTLINDLDSRGRVIPNTSPNSPVDRDVVSCLLGFASCCAIKIEH